MKPPRTSSLWLTASASPGASRRVGMKSADNLAVAREPAVPPGAPSLPAVPVTPAVSRCLGGLLDWALCCLGHHERRRLGELEPLRPLHAGADPAVDLVEELVHE